MALEVAQRLDVESAAAVAAPGQPLAALLKTSPDEATPEVSKAECFVSQTAYPHSQGALLEINTGWLWNFIRPPTFPSLTSLAPSKFTHAYVSISDSVLYELPASEVSNAAG